VGHHVEVMALKNARLIYLADIFETIVGINKPGGDSGLGLTPALVRTQNRFGVSELACSDLSAAGGSCSYQLTESICA